LISFRLFKGDRHPNVIGRVPHAKAIFGGIFHKDLMGLSQSLFVMCALHFQAEVAQDFVALFPNRDRHYVVNPERSCIGSFAVGEDM
jgi:hypothetical protein